MMYALDSDTEYRVIKSETSVGKGGIRRGEPTGEIRCEECGQAHVNIDEIPHEVDCSQRYSRTNYWRTQFLGS